MSFGPLEIFLELLKVKKYLPNLWFLHIFEPYGFCRLTISGSMKIEKTSSPYVWICIARTKCRGMLPFVSADSYDPKEAFKHICWVMECIRKFFRDTQRQRPCSLKYSFFTLLDAFNGFTFERGMKTEKSPSPYVWICIVRIKYRGMPDCFHG